MHHEKHSLPGQRQRPPVIGAKAAQSRYWTKGSSTPIIGTKAALSPLLDQGQLDMELCARAVGWRETDLASMFLDYAPDDVEPETGSLHFAF